MTCLNDPVYTDICNVYIYYNIFIIVTMYLLLSHKYIIIVTPGALFNGYIYYIYIIYTMYYYYYITSQ